MTAPLASLIATGTKLWLDSIDPDLVSENLAWGATGATSNPIIIADLIKTRRFDSVLGELIRAGQNDEQIAWELTDRLVRQAQTAFHDAWRTSGGNDGYVSFELDPLLEDPQLGPPLAERAARYIELGKRWSAGHDNRMIKVPATPAGIAALEELAAAGVTINVTLIFTARQYRESRDAIWRGAQLRASLDRFKSVYSIFVSRIDVYTEKHVAELSPAAQGQVGIVNAKRLWAENRRFWREHPTPLAQEIIFASTGSKKPNDPPWKYVAALAGGDIQTNPPPTNAAVAGSGMTFTPQLEAPIPEDVGAEIDAKVDFGHLEHTLMSEGVEKFASPQKTLLALIADRRAAL